MLRIKQIILLICAVCVADTTTIITGLTGTVASAAAADMASCINTAQSYAPTSMGGATDAVISSFGSATLTGEGSTPSNKLGSDDTVKEYFSYAGTTDSDKTTRAASRIPLRKIGYNGAAYSSTTAKILHVGWTMTNTAGTAVNLLYTYNSGETGKTFASWTPDDTDGSGNMLLTSGSYSAYVNPSYHADWFVDAETGKWRLYINNILFSEDSLASSNATLRNLYFLVPVNTTYNYTISDTVYMTYIPTEVGGETITPTMDDVVAYTLTKDTTRDYWWPTSCRNDGYYWQSTGIGDIGGTAGKRLVGNTSGIKSGSGAVSGTDYIVKAPASTTSESYGGVGWRFRTLTANGTNTTKGCLPRDAGNNSVIMQSAIVTPSLSDGNSFAIGFRGNNNVQAARCVFDADDGFVSGESYDFKIITTCCNNGTSYYYDAYIVVDGTLVWRGQTNTSGYLSEIIYSVGKSDNDTLTLSNITTTMYDSTVSVYDIVMQYADSVYLDITDFVYDDSDDSLTVTATLFGKEGTFDEAQLIYAAYDETGILLATSSEAVDNSIVNSTSRGRNYPYGVFDLTGVEDGAKLRVKAFLWSNYNTIIPKSLVKTSNYTVDKGVQ